ncbi:MAG: VanZ family protein [Anaerolineae bacterium]
MLQSLKKWWPSIVMMALIFAFSARPSEELPDFGCWDTLFKKSGHVLGYGLLALSYWSALSFRRERGGLAWLLTVLYALSDEFHQSFVAGRHASLLDVFLFDNLGALLAIGAFRFFKRKAKAKMSPSQPEW